MSDLLKNFNGKAQESIIQWFKIVKMNCSVSKMDEIDYYYIDQMLLIIEWNNNGLLKYGEILLLVFTALFMAMRIKKHGASCISILYGLELTRLSVKTQKDSTLDLCYYLTLESLQKAPSSFIRFKAIESLDPVEGLRSHYMIEAIREKSSQDAGDLKGKGKIITTDNLTSTPNSDNSISMIVNTELSCPLTLEYLKFQKILSCCKNYISSEALQRIINDNNKSCSFCRKIIDLNSVISLPQSEICQRICNYSPKDDNIIS
ncbi:TPR-like protein [Gigaspora margarita]|uniref:TPR-like protein n=1 Tax=Gigaspora margarita TaxID=4874 RepID=A0A8H4A8E9_GIGMA|nr:TPR-like protein [Gigaspora margarita]